eukprot:TRINITY_DN22916_c0_g1_i1.p1 TRINITY_DN22916_c0_g1~~TRINITY_DN22916_c0_g1_i1.p1  ORF type:complete len:452 (+),score=57.20 TRINITY_DN22916_c0_g1_i1:146-1357(+)
MITTSGGLTERWQDRRVLTSSSSDSVMGLGTNPSSNSMRRREKAAGTKVGDEKDNQRVGEKKMSADATIGAEIGQGKSRAVQRRRRSKVDGETLSQQTYDCPDCGKVVKRLNVRQHVMYECSKRSEEERKGPGIDSGGNGARIDTDLNTHVQSSSDARDSRGVNRINGNVSTATVELASLDLSRVGRDDPEEIFEVEGRGSRKGRGDLAQSSLLTSWERQGMPTRKPGNRPHGKYYYVLDTCVLMEEKYRMHFELVVEGAAGGVEPILVIPYVAYNELEKHKTASLKPNASDAEKTEVERKKLEATEALGWISKHKNKSWMTMAKQKEYSPYVEDANMNNDDKILGVAFYFKKKYGRDRGMLITSDEHLGIKGQYQDVAILKPHNVRKDGTPSIPPKTVEESP